MKNTQALFSYRSIVPVFFFALSGFTSLAQSQNGIASDWSHRHLIFSNPGKIDDAIRNGDYNRWLRISSDPRYAAQQMRRGGLRENLRTELLPGSKDEESKHDQTTINDDEPHAESARNTTESDFPDGVLPRGLTRALIPPPFAHSEHAARANGKKENNNLIHRDWSEDVGSSGTTGLGNSPATFTGNSASCTADFVVYNNGLKASSSQAGIVAYNHLYSGCSPRPSVYWAFDTGGAPLTSVVLSIDGTQVAFVQTDNSTGSADLVVLKWAASSGTIASPTILTSNSSYPNCSAPCMVSIPFSGSATDTYSSPFVDYSTGTAYVGDDAGKMHKFTNIFSVAKPAETASPWPVTLNTSTDAALGSPVYDSVSGKVFVGDYLSNPSSNCQPGVITTEGQCGYLYSIAASSGTVVRSAQLDFNFGINDSPIVDSSAGIVYAFVGADASTSCSSGPCAAVFQYPVNFTNGAIGTEATVGAGYEFLMSGTFDNQYFTSSEGSPSGHLYVVGGTGPQNNTLYAITISNNAMTAGSATAGPQVAANYTNGYYSAGLQVSEFCNNGSNSCTASQGTDYLFLSVLSFGAQFTANPCPNPSLKVGCVMGLTAPPSGAISSSATPNGTLQEAGGTSGIVVDNGTSGASNIYFSTLLDQACTTSGGTGGCATSATQAALQ